MLHKVVIISGVRLPEPPLSHAWRNLVVIFYSIMSMTIHLIFTLPGITCRKPVIRHYQAGSDPVSVPSDAVGYLHSARQLTVH